MNKYYYKLLSQWERRKLESLICNKPILKPIFGTTDHGWNIVNWKWLIDINSLEFGHNTKEAEKQLKENC